MKKIILVLVLLMVLIVGAFASGNKEGMFNKEEMAIMKIKVEAVHGPVESRSLPKPKTLEQVAQSTVDILGEPTKIDKYYSAGYSQAMYIYDWGSIYIIYTYEKNSEERGWVFDSYYNSSN